MSPDGEGEGRGSWTGGVPTVSLPSQVSAVAGLVGDQAAAVGIPRVRYLHEELSILVSGQVRPKGRD